MSYQYDISDISYQIEHALNEISILKKKADKAQARIKELVVLRDAMTLCLEQAKSAIGRTELISSNCVTHRGVVSHRCGEWCDSWGGPTYCSGVLASLRGLYNGLLELEHSIKHESKELEEANLLIGSTQEWIQLNEPKPLLSLSDDEEDNWSFDYDRLEDTILDKMCYRRKRRQLTKYH